MTDDERERLLEMPAVRELLAEERQKTLAVLRRLEWSGWEFGEGNLCCPECRGYKEEGHMSGCTLFALLEPS
jgi:hypothetical protein